MNVTPMPFSAELSRIEVGEEDWRAQPPADLLWMLQQMFLIRRFEETLLALKDEDLVNGPVHTSVGQEAVAAGAAAAIGVSDRITGTHRAHHQYLAKALCACRAPGHDPVRDGLTPDMRAHVTVLLKEIMGLAEGCSGGRGGSMHLFNAAIGVAGTNAIVGGGVPVANGVAWSDTAQGNENVTLCFFGDGALYQGTIHESCNLASIWRAPVIFVVENNRYAVATASDNACSAPRLCEVAGAYGLPGLQADGMDPVSVRTALEHVLANREAMLPCFVELETYRHLHHAGPNPGSAYKYRDKAEEETWRERDPLTVCEDRLRRMGVLDDKARDVLLKNAETCVAEAADVCVDRSSGEGRVREHLWPTADTLGDGLRDYGVADIGPFHEMEDLACSREIKYSDAIAEGIGRWLEKDPTVFILGEEVANFGGGAYGATKGLPTRYPERVRNTPITEAGFCGLACGAAINGMRPIVELMFSSFGLVAADQLFNQIGQLAHIYGGHASVPLVVRTRVAIGLGYGAQHSMDPIALFSLFPGWRIFAPTTPFDHIGLFNAAMQLRSPTLIVEHHSFYDETGMIPEGAPAHTVEPGKAKVVRAGGDVTVVACAYGVRLALEAAANLATEGIEAEVIDLRSLDDASLDYAAIGHSLDRTGMLVTVDQAPACSSIGAKVLAECQKRFFDSLDGPGVSVNAANVPLPVSRRLEQLCLPTVEKVAETVRKAARRQV